MPDPNTPLSSNYSPTPESMVKQLREAADQKRIDDFLGSFKRDLNPNDPKGQSFKIIEGITGEDRSLGFEDLPLVGKFFADPLKEAADISTKKAGETLAQQAAILPKTGFLAGLPAGIVLDKLTDVTGLGAGEEAYLADMNARLALQAQQSPPSRADPEASGVVSMPPVWRADP